VVRTGAKCYEVKKITTPVRPEVNGNLLYLFFLPLHHLRDALKKYSIALRATQIEMLSYNPRKIVITTHRAIQELEEMVHAMNPVHAEALLSCKA
jgi:hypothetical protein